MGDEYDDDMFMFDDDNWIYVEDEFGLADELAESQIADPGYAGNNEEIYSDRFEYDPFEFWDDLEYANDEYWEYGGRLVKKDGIHTQAGQKRKLNGDAHDEKPEKRLKMSGTYAPGVAGGGYSADYDTVVFRSLEQRTRPDARNVPILEGKKGRFAFLPDWRVRFADPNSDPVEVGVDDMPVDMKRAAEMKDDETPLHPDMEAEEMDGEDEGWEDDEDEDEEDEGGLGALDPEMLKKALKERLGAAGLEGMDEGAFMETISKMLAGGGEDDDAAGALANSLLGKASSGNDTALTGWLSGQGVSLDAEEDDDASSVATAEPAQGSSGPSVPVVNGARRARSPDSGIGVTQDSSQSKKTETPLRPASAKKSTVSPAKAVAQEEEKEAETRAPTTSKAPEPETETAPEPESTNPPSADEEDEDDDSITVIPRDSTKTTPTKGKKAAPAKEDKKPAATAKKTTAKAKKAAEKAQEVEETAASTKPTRQTRKRKADTEEPETTKTTAAPAAKKTRSSTRTTRSKK